MDWKERLVTKRRIQLIKRGVDVATDAADNKVRLKQVEDRGGVVNAALESDPGKEETKDSKLKDLQIKEEAIGTD